MRKILFYLSLLIIPISCKKATAEYDSMAVMVDSVAVEDADRIVESALLPPPPPPSEYSSAKTDAPMPVQQEDIQPKIIKTGRLRFETSDLEASFSSVKKAITSHQASVQSDVSGTNDEYLYRNITIRIPSVSFDSFISEISKGVKHFDRKEISAEDVTEEYIDVEARLNTKKALEKRYFELLGKATKVSEMLEIEKSLSEVREDIEAKEGRLKFLKSQVSMSTVHLEMYTNIPSESGATVSYGGKMGNAFKEGFNNIATFFLRMVNVWPFILIFVIGFFLIRRRRRRKTT